MKNLTRLRMQRFFIRLFIRPTWENLCIASTLIVPLALIIFLPAESLLAFMSFALFLLTITVFDIKKDRDYWKHSWELCRNLLEEERKKQ